MFWRKYFYISIISQSTFTESFSLGSPQQQCLPYFHTVSIPQSSKQCLWNWGLRKTKSQFWNTKQHRNTTTHIQKSICSYMHRSLQSEQGIDLVFFPLKIGAELFLPWCNTWFEQLLYALPDVYLISNSPAYSWPSFSQACWLVQSVYNRQKPLHLPPPRKHLR